LHELCKLIKHADHIVLELGRMWIEERQFAQFFFNDVHHMTRNNQVLQVDKTAET